MVLFFWCCILATVAGFCLALVVTWFWAWRRDTVDHITHREKTERTKLIRDAKAQKAQRLAAEQTEPAEKSDARTVAQTDANASAASTSPATPDPTAADGSDMDYSAECQEMLSKRWSKVKQPEFAIGQGLLTRDAYNSIRNEYYAQSLISIGLILPLTLLTFALLVTPEMGVKPNLFLWVFFIPAQAALVMIGADRRHKFDTEVESTISGAFLKNCEAAKKPAKSSSSAKKPTMTDLIREELKNLKIVKDQGLTIELGDKPAEPPKQS